MEPCADSMISTSPSRTCMALAVLGCSSAQESQTTVVRVSGDSCSQGRFAGRPSRKLGLTDGIRLKGYLTSMLLAAGGSDITECRRDWVQLSHQRLLDRNLKPIRLRGRNVGAKIFQ